MGPIALFDSGLGGLSVLREVRRLLPAEPLLYLADQAYLPYGDRPLSQVRDRVLAVGRYLVEREGAKLLVVACNTASAAALEALRAALPVPVVGMEPAVKPAARRTRSGRIAVLATAATLRAERLERLVRRYAADQEVIRQPCPGWVELVEAGHWDDEAAREAVARVVLPLREAGVDTFVLGCTHYPFLRPALEAVLGPGVQILETGEPVARRVRQVLEAHGLETPDPGPGTLRICTTGDPRRAAERIGRLLGEAVPVEGCRIG